VGIDSLPANIAAARENARLNGVNNCRFEEGTVEGLSKHLIKEAFHAIVVDPPRTGLSREASGFLIEAAAPVVVYISCDPATLARDLKVLCAGGYRAAIVAPFDFFPHAAHVETLVILERQGVGRRA
jgi:23S rRNA (uracil1939-C5)-methyltransferase